MQGPRGTRHPLPRARVRAGVALGGAAALLGGLVTAVPAQAVAGAAFTTNADGQRVNQNQYASKCDVHINGGPNNGANSLTDGTYFFSVLTPGGQLDPNDGGDKVLYADSSTDRTFTVATGKITSAGTAYASSDDPSTERTDDLLVQLCRPGDPTNYADTENPGGVYILAVCRIGGTVPVRPQDCKYDAFKVKSTTPGDGGPQGDDLVAIKSADPRFTRTYAWDVEKAVDKTSVSLLGGTATFNYTVDATRSAPVDSAFALTGEITVFNPNDTAVSGVSVSDETLGVPCPVVGGAVSIPAGASETFTYSCDLGAAANTATTGTNVASIAWDAATIGSPHGTTTAEAGYDFASAAVTSIGDTTDVTDLFDGTTTSLATGLTASRSFIYPRTVPVPASNCVTHTNTAVVTQSGDSDTETVRVCGPNQDGYTIGFWKNNSAKLITATSAGAYCNAILQYSNVLGSPCTAGANTAANAKAINTWIAKTMAEGESSGTGLPMLKAQFLATTLSVQRTAALGSTKILLTAAETTALGGLPSCASVTTALSAANATYATLKTSKLGVVLVKDVFDRTNNNRQLTC